MARPSHAATGPALDLVQNWRSVGPSDAYVLRQNHSFSLAGWGRFLDPRLDELPRRPTLSASEITFRDPDDEIVEVGIYHDSFDSVVRDKNLLILYHVRERRAIGELGGHAQAD